MTERTNPILKHFRTDNVSSSFRSHDKCTNILSQLVAQLRCRLYFYVSSSCGNMWYQQKKGVGTCCRKLDSALIQVTCSRNLEHVAIFDYQCHNFVEDKLQCTVSVSVEIAKSLQFFLEVALSAG